MELPEELICEIMEHLPQRDLGRFTQVCRDLNRIGSEDSMWRKKGLLKRDIETSSAGSSTDNVPSARLCHTMVVYNNKIYVMGGHNTEADSQRFSEVKSDLYTYDIAKRSWEKLVVRNMPSKTEHCSVVYKDKLWMFGGYSGHTFSYSLYMLHLATGSHCTLLKTQGEVPTGRSALVGGVFEHKMYIFGGWDGLMQNNDFYSFDFNNSTWTRIQPSGNATNGEETSTIPFARCSHTMAISNARRSMYIFGGYGGKTRNYLNDMWSYNFDTQLWNCINAKGDIPLPRSRMRMIEWNDKLYVFGGWDKAVHYDDLYEFDLETSTWTKLDIGIEKNDDSNKIGQHSMVVVDNILYIFGGFNAKLKRSTNDLYAFRLGLKSKSNLNDINPNNRLIMNDNESNSNSNYDRNSNGDNLEDKKVVGDLPLTANTSTNNDWIWMEI